MSMFNKDTTGGTGYKDRQVVVYKVQQVAGYKVSLFFRAPKVVIFKISLLKFNKSNFFSKFP